MPYGLEPCKSLTIGYFSEAYDMTDILRLSMKCSIVSAILKETYRVAARLDTQPEIGRF